MMAFPCSLAGLEDEYSIPSQKKRVATIIAVG
jgi:hypothetical protein